MPSILLSQAFIIRNINTVIAKQPKNLITGHHGAVPQVIMTSTIVSIY
jgi:hypothetical protein